MRPNRISIFVLLGVVAGAALSAQAPPAASVAPGSASPPPSFGESVEVRVVNVEVVVTDRSGRPITDLERGDFRLEVDGRPVEISYFARTVGTAAPAPLPTAPAAPAPSATTAPPPVPPPPAVVDETTRLRLAVWVDDLHTLPAHRNRVLRELETLLVERERAGAEVLLARYDRKYELLRNFSDRSRPISADLATLAQRAASGVFVESARRSAFEEIDSIYAMDRCTRIDDMTRAALRYAEPLEHDSRSSLNALRAMVQALAGVPGRRALLYVTDGLPLVPGQEALLYVDQICGGTEASKPKATLVDDLRRVSAEANAAGVTFYTLDAGGLPVGGGAELSGRGLDWTNASAARANLQDPLTQMADATGGRALLNANRLAPLLEGLARDLDSGYSLGFTPAAAPDGKEHRLEVSVARDGVRVRHREGFRDRDGEEQRHGRLLAVLRFGGGSNPLGATLEVERARPIDRGTSFLPVKVAVPAASLLFLGSPPEQAAARLEISFAVADDAGALSPVQTRPITVDRARLAGAPPDVRLRFPLDLRVRKGHARLAALIRDLAAQSESIVWAEVAVE